MGIYIKDFKMPEGGYRTIEIGYDADGHPMAITDGGDVFDVILADDVLPRDEAIKMGAELAAMHGSDATSQQLEEAYFKGVENGMTRRNVRPVPDGGIGEMSDGYHTFNGLYYQRMVLFAALVIAHNDKAWKSWKHEDGEPCFGGGWFIVGIDTPKGSYTYHYEDKYWNWFECEELPVAKHWDGHTEEDVTRLLSLDMPRWIPVTERLPEEGKYVLAYSADDDFTAVEARHKFSAFQITHWQPLPEPPKEE